ncbi:branched-chain amino acid ABC transporter permease [Alcaligenes faecalis]|jgi:branched-chain amino acid transport system permease protein|uniref:Branched-chain amino acid ABC transporter permease n=1 Tax=Alcaligenes faecalis TaxID=511 RepID=A0ABY7N2E6_ALCFA|nr:MULTISPECIES: branched-chain amino acid ABC transporter permease [Alcaligenes]ARP51926.1 ABC transporter permease [Alcaligenes faecalis]KAA1284573.1 branched-chain amino acid ABC transporter permease [Alcaligenes faecalis]MBH0309742.1 branched-chain amino acid ABC transporter permease [Alcaligenes faecalis]MDT0218121.1 branched-chain amino acid ABC transporter permease [Alcaligenes sp. AB3]USP48012.1 branched-chain amino acid ABC transporter permease [Alcaligenes faecalis]
MSAIKTASFYPRDGALQWVWHAVVVAVLLGWPVWAGQPRFALHLAIMVSLYACLAMSMNLVLRIGQLSLAHGALFGLGAYASAILSRDYGWSFPAAFLGAGVLTAALAVITGPVFMRIKGVHFALLTFALGEAVVLCFIEFHELFGGNNGFGQIPSLQASLPIPEGRYGVYLVTVSFALVVYFVLRALYRREWGMVADSLHQNEQLVRSGGLNVLRFRVSVFVLSALIAGWTGSLYAHYQGYISPDSFGFWTAVNAVIMNVLGGVGALAGAVVGAAILIPLPELLRDLQQYQRLIYGLTLILLLLFMPQGLAGLWRKWRGARKEAA